jgi:hypothetical protein
MWAGLGSRSSWSVPGDRSWGLHNLPQILKTEEIWPHRGDMGTPPHSAPAQAQHKAGAAMTMLTMVLVTHGVELSTGTWWLRNPLTSQRGRMPNPTFGPREGSAKWSLGLTCHRCYQQVPHHCSGTLAKISPFSSFPESSLGSCSERTQNL